MTHQRSRSDTGKECTNRLTNTESSHPGNKQWNDTSKNRHPIFAALSPSHGSNKRSAEEAEGEPDDRGGRS